MSLVWNGQEIAGLMLNGQQVSACYNGQIVWPSNPARYSETLLWSGNWNKDSIDLSGHPSAYDVIRVVPGGGNAGANALLYNPVEVSWKQLSSTNNMVFENTMFGTTAASGVNAGYWFGGQISGCSGTSWGFQYAEGRRWNVTSPSERYDFAYIRQIWGIKYG